MDATFDAAKLTIDHVREAHERIRPHIHRTPVMTSAYLDGLTGAELYFKCENFQKVGAFKPRGACNAVFGLSDAVAERGVGTHSSGNHAQAVSYAARRRGVPAHVVMPRNAPASKKNAVLDYGGLVYECEPTAAAREAAFARVQQETGCEFIHPYDDPRVIAGQATCALELLEEVEGLDVVIAPISGGGLMSGTCLSVRSLAPGATIYGAEPEQADDANRSLKAGRLITEITGQTIADGLRMPLRPTTWRFISAHVADIFTVSEQEIATATKLVWERMKIVIEPSSAVPLAAILKNREAFAGRRVGVIVSGGNLDLDHLPWLGA